MEGQSGQAVVLLPDPEEHHQQLQLVVSTHGRKQRGGLRSRRQRRAKTPLAALISAIFITSQGRKHSSDVAKIYSVHISNVMGGVASQCRRCALSLAGYSSTCVPCPPGHYMVNGTGACESCPPNTIIRADQSVGLDACVPCGPNTGRNEVKQQEDGNSGPE